MPAENKSYCTLRGENNLRGTVISATVKTIARQNNECEILYNTNRQVIFNNMPILTHKRFFLICFSLKRLFNEKLNIKYLKLNKIRSSILIIGARGGVVVKALRYKPAGRGFDSRWCHWNFFSDIILQVALWPRSRLSL
jgi:hypothetical protein